MKNLGKIFSDFRNFIGDIRSGFGNVINSLSPSSLHAAFFDTKEKLANLKETNWELAQYHLSAGNISDAIMRFKILKRFEHRVDECNYFLCLLYFRKNKFKRAKEFLNLYLASADRAHREECEYCMRVMESVPINYIPDSIIKLKRDAIASNTNSSGIDGSLLMQYHEIINCLKPVVSSSSKILEVGCYLGILGRSMRETFKIQYLAGCEFGPKSLEIARSGIHNDSKVYDAINLVNGPNFPEGSSIYSIIVVPDMMKYYNCLEVILRQSKDSLEEGGLLVFIVRKTQSQLRDKTSVFINLIEEFAYNPDYVLSTAKSYEFSEKSIIELENNFSLFVLTKDKK